MPARRYPAGIRRSLLFQFSMTYFRLPSVLCSAATLTVAVGAIAGLAHAEDTGAAKSMAAFSDSSATKGATVPSSPTPTPGQSMLAQGQPPVLTDVSPGHWAAPAIGQLTQSSACLSGYPDNTFRGDQAVTRYEFAAALDACLGQILELQAAAQPSLDSILQDLEALQQELGALEGDVDALESN
jgi:hypothetical protein